MSASSFAISIPQDRLDWINRRIDEYEWADMPANGGWAYGTNMDYLKELVAYWRNEYDWRAVEADLNSRAHFLAPVEVEGETINMHCVVEKGSGSAPKPLVITHGWPGSFFEFWQVIDRLAHPEKFGGDAEQGFDVILPSLPGYGFSGKPANPIGPRKAAAYINKLVIEALGYGSYFAQGGDWGSMVTSWLGYDHDACTAIHLNMLGFRPQGDQAVVGDEEKAWADHGAMMFNLEGAYFRLQSTKPQSLSYAMMDSPVGQAAWIIEKFTTWSDTDGDNVESCYTKDQLLTNIMIYVATRTFGTATWMYRGFVEEMMSGNAPAGRCETPTAVANFPGDPMLTWPPRSMVDRAYNVARWTDMPKGGHFAAMEQPELFVDDVREYFTAL